MSDGDCGHGWLYHDNAQSPCRECQRVEAEIRKVKAQGVREYRARQKKRKQRRSRK